MQLAVIRYLCIVHSMPQKASTIITEVRIMKNFTRDLKKNLKK